MYVPCTVPMNSARTKPNLAQSYAIRNDLSAKIMIYEGAGNNSLSALKSLHNGLLHNPLVAEVLYVYNAIRGHQLTFLWIPSHVGIHGNELADTLAKFSLHHDVNVDVKLPFETCDLSLHLTSLGCCALTGKTTRQTKKLSSLVSASATVT